MLIMIYWYLWWTAISCHVDVLSPLSAHTVFAYFLFFRFYFSLLFPCMILAKFSFQLPSLPLSTCTDPLLCSREWGVFVALVPHHHAWAVPLISGVVIKFFWGRGNCFYLTQMKDSIRQRIHSPQLAIQPHDVHVSAQKHRKRATQWLLRHLMHAVSGLEMKSHRKKERKKETRGALFAFVNCHFWVQKPTQNARLL